jgi:Sulfotransferase domain
LPARHAWADLLPREQERRVRLIEDGGMVWSLGMYASGSTWLFNALLKLAETLAPDLPRVSRFVASMGDVGDLRAARRLLLVKSHETDLPAEAALTAVAQLVVISIRDPLDVVASMLLYQHREFAKALDLTEKSVLQCARLAGDPRALLLRYEAAFTDDPATLDRLAAKLGGALRPAERSRIFAATRRREVDRYIAGLPGRPGVLIHKESGDMLDPTTHWHTHHANRTGEVGRWRRTLTPPQVAEIRERLGAWMEANLYPPQRPG